MAGNQAYWFYLFKRILLIIPSLFWATCLIFLLLRIIPGDATLSILAGSTHTEEMRESLREEIGLNESLPTQYVRWLGSMLRGDFGGNSLENREPIRSIIFRQLPVTLLLAVYASVLSILIAVPLAILSASRSRTPLDYLIRFGSFAGLSIPGVWAALLIILALLRLFRWSPPIFYTSLRADPINHLLIMIWPAFLLAAGFSAQLLRIIRAGILEALQRDHIVAARSRGVAEGKILTKYAFRLSLAPAVTMIGVQFGVLLGGTLVLETIFGIPGIGRALVQAAVFRDYPVVQSIVTILVSSQLVLNLILDFFYSIIDPRISHRGLQNAPS